MKYIWLDFDEISCWDMGQMNSIYINIAKSSIVWDGQPAFFLLRTIPALTRGCAIALFD